MSRQLQFTRFGALHDGIEGVLFFCLSSRTPIIRTLTALLLGAALFWPTAQAAVTVYKGDTLYSISRRVGLSVEQLRRLNHLSGNTIAIGQVLKTSGPAPSTVPHKIPSKAHPKQPVAKVTKVLSPTRYTVRAGDTLAKVARRTGSSVLALQQVNHLRGTVIQVGQRLTVPPPGWKPTPAQAARRTPSLPANMEYRSIYSYVLAGRHDTFARLHAKSGLSKTDFMRINHLTAPQIFAGMQILLPRQVAVRKPPTPLRPPAQLIRTVAAGVPVTLVRVDLRHKGVLVSPVLPRWGLGGAGARVGTLARQSSAIAVINGSYFHPRSYVPAGDLVVHGQQLANGRIPAALAITPDNRAQIVSAYGQSWQGMETVIASGPQIVRGGAVLSEYSRVFRDPAVFAPARRSAIGLVGSRDLLLVTTTAQIGVGQMGQVMAALGASDALLLDGGSSTGLAWNGVALNNSTRSVSYGIGVFLDYQGRRFQRD